MFSALVVDKKDDGSITHVITSLDESHLPEGDVTVRVTHSTLNYKDGLCLTGGGGLVRNYPHVKYGGSVAAVGLAGGCATNPHSRSVPAARSQFAGH